MQHTYKFIIRNSKFVIISVFVFLMLIIPALSLAEIPPAEPDGLIPCGKGSSDPCEFGDFLVLIDTVIKFILFKMAVPIAAIMFAYAGFKLVTAGGESEHARSGAKDIFTNTVIGLIFAVAAFLIIKTILIIFGFKEVGMFFN